MLKKTFSIITLIFILFGLIQNNVFADKKSKKYFRVTAYYSPLPNQSHYIKGTYKKELIMNGMGIRGASGKKVFSGMLAAPSIYSFGTKIRLKGLGIGEVADRGGAIVKSGERSFKHDRIDIWCGHGEKGLQRAMFWGNRVIEGEIINKKSKNTLKINNIPAPRWTIYHATKNPDLIARKGSIKRKVYLASKKENKINSPIIPFHIPSRGTSKMDENIFSKPIRNSTGVKILQKKLQEIELYSGKIDGEYSSIRKIILDFQLKNKVISKNTDIGAGNFGPKTRKILKEKYNLFLENNKLKAEKLEIEKQKQALIQKQKKEAFTKATKKINSLGNLKFGNISYKVRELQIILKKLGFFKYKDTAIFGEKTRQALINYQISRKLIKNKNSRGSGVFGPNTKRTLIGDLSGKV